MMETLFISVISNTDLLHMLQLSVSEVLQLRLLSGSINERILKLRRFWLRAFPVQSNLIQTTAEYSTHVIEICERRYRAKKLIIYKSLVKCRNQERRN